MDYHGRPCWFELGTSDLDAAGAFYGGLLGWRIEDSGMPGFDYRLARRDDLVAGMMGLDHQPPGTAPNWLLYLCVDSADDTARKAADRGGRVLKEPADIPGTGRYAVLADPQGAVFGVLQPLPMDPVPSPDQGAWNQRKAGHGNWLELMSTDPEAGFDFYAALFGWTRGERMEMGDSGAYQLFAWNGEAIGGMMGLGDAPASCWLCYFGVDGAVSDAVARIRATGGTVHAGPVEVPGPAWIAVARDPQGAWFAVVGGAP